MNLNMKPSELAGVSGVIDPDANAAGTYTTGWVAMRDWQSLMAVIMAGDLGASATLDAKLEQATTSGGASAKDVTGKAITQLTQAGTDSNKQVLINLRPEELDVEGGFDYVRLSMTVAVATSDSGAVLLGVYPTRGPASDVDAATVDEIVG
jgi:hypothetical protein